MKKSILFLSALFAGIMLFGTVYAQNVYNLLVYYNGKRVEFKSTPLISDGCTIVPVRDLSEMAGFSVTWDGNEKRVDISNAQAKVRLYIGNKNISVVKNGSTSTVTSILAPQIINSVTYVPLRTVAESLGAEVVWNSSDNSININTKSTTSNTFYSQYDKDYIAKYSGAPYYWTSSRNGYCYVVSYAMLLTDITGKTVTPKDIADINLAAGGKPNTCYHGAIVSKYGRKLVPALDSSSQYYKSYDAARGLTYIDTSSDANVIAAIKEALQRNPKGVMVRDLSMPHTIVAVGYEGNTVYFNDPALQVARVPWAKTCLKKRPITTLIAIMAIQ